MEEAAKFISQVGFPAFVAIWLLLRSDRVAEANTNAINALAKEMAAFRQILSDRLGSRAA